MKSTILKIILPACMLNLAACGGGFKLGENGDSVNLASSLNDVTKYISNQSASLATTIEANHGQTIVIQNPAATVTRTAAAAVVSPATPEEEKFSFSGYSCVGLDGEIKTLVVGSNAVGDRSLALYRAPATATDFVSTGTMPVPQEWTGAEGYVAPASSGKPCGEVLGQAVGDNEEGFVLNEPTVSLYPQVTCSLTDYGRKTICQ